MIAAFLLSCVQAVNQPVEVVIDCSTWPGMVETNLDVRFVAWDGTAIVGHFVLPAETDPSSPRTGFRLLFENKEWRFKYLENYQVLVLGSKTAPLRRVSFESDGWKPECRYFLAPLRPAAIAPMPREKK